jgi:mono/diheme cytochrome c family protein
VSPPTATQSLDREEAPDPVAGTAGPPIWLFILLALTGYWATMYLDQNAGGFHPLVYEPYHSLRDVDDRHPKSESAAFLAKGQTAFKAYCSACHMDTGLGNPGTFIPPLAGSEWVIGEGPNRLIRIVLNSVNGPITVKGQVFDNPAMPPWRDTITDDAELAALISFVRGNKEWGNAASPVTPEQVKVIRDATADRGRPWTAPELLNVPEKD